jgi:GH43 family beta-xylosidase
VRRRTARTTAPRARALLAAAGVLLTALATGVPAASAYPGAPWFEPDKPYTENFPDPDVLRVDGTYYAYGTSTGGAYLPVMRSTDLRTWIARSAYDPGPPLNEDPYFNDALPYPASWGADVNGGRMTKEIWAPGVEQIGGRFVAFYSIRTQISPERFCISVATASSPEGPFTDSTSGPLVCDPDPKGSIDPEPFVDPATGTPYLVWKSEGVPGSMPTRIWIRQLSRDGTSFAPGSAPRELLRTSQGWEGNLIESPSMVRHDGQLYLFYSANEWTSADYATGYATCSDVLGPCTKPRGTPLLASSGDRLGPGAPSAFVDGHGRLQLAHHYWNAPYTNYPAYPECERNDSCTTQGQRRMAITELSAGAGGLQVGAVRPTPTAKTTEQACPPDRVPEDGFGDVPDGNVHESAIDCVAWWQVTTGSNGQYLPSAGVTRGQMASFLARAILNSGGDLPAPRKDAFRDDDGTTHEENINRLAAAGIVNGLSADSYGPSAPVTRAQMATFLVRTVRHRTGQELSSATDWFYDDGGTHEPNINAAAEAGLATGTGGGAYSPGVTVRRDQMASFLSRMLELFVEAGASTPSR